MQSIRLILGESMKKIIINKNSWQTRIAITEDGKLVNLYLSAHVEQPLERIYLKGTVTKVLPGIQTAFVDIGQPKAGFLHISEIDRDLAITNMSQRLQLDESGNNIQTKPKKRPTPEISKILKEGDPILVQVSKEPVYEKGAKLTTCFTLPGRFIVLMPNIPRIGISKKIDNREERNRLREVVTEALPEGMGAIIRTTSADRGKREIKKDITYLVNTWKTIQKNYKAAQPRDIIHEDLEIALQIVRDHLDADVETVISDNTEHQKTIHKFVKVVAPEFAQSIKAYTGQKPVFEHFGIEQQIESVLHKKAPLKSGGSLIIESTEAMTVVDVNTGKFTGKSNLEETIFKTNLEAAEEIVRQLRLRNIGGLIVIDFIDMATISNRQKLFRFFEKTLKTKDKFQSVVLKVSEFGLVQMTRKRSGKTLVQQLTDDCSKCKGAGFIKSLQTEAYVILRKLKQDIKKHQACSDITLQLNPDMFNYMSNIEYNSILQLESVCKCKIILASAKGIELTQYKIQKK